MSNLKKQIHPFNEKKIVTAQFKKGQYKTWNLHQELQLLLYLSLFWLNGKL